MTFRYDAPSYTRTMHCHACGESAVIDPDDVDDGCPCGYDGSEPLPEPPPVPPEGRSVALTMRPPVLFSSEGESTDRIELGCPGHFIGAADCGFRRHTHVGRWRVSTIGDYRPRASDGNHPLREIGVDRYYETMVFPIDEEGRVTSWNEVEMRGYDTAEEAQAGHEEMVAMAIRGEL